MGINGSAMHRYYTMVQHSTVVLGSHCCSSFQVERSDIHTYIHTYINTYIHTYVHYIIYAHIHIHMHAHRRTYNYILYTYKDTRFIIPSTLDTPTLNATVAETITNRTVTIMMTTLPIMGWVRLRSTWRPITT